MSAWVNVILRFALIAIILWGLTLTEGAAEPEPPPENAKPAIAPTNNLALQIVRLYAEVGDSWEDSQRTRLAEYLSATGDFSTAARLYSGLVIPQDGIEGQLLVVEQLLQDQAWVAAHQTLLAILNSDANNHTANFWLGLLTLPDDAAYDHIQTAANTVGPYQPTSAAIVGILGVQQDAFLEIALRLIEIEAWSVAEYLLSQQIARAPVDALAFAYRGFVKDQQGADGRSDIENAIALDPSLALAYFMLGQHYRAKAEFDESLTAFIDAHLLAPENPAYAAEVAISYQLSDELALAEEWYAQAVELAEDGDPRFMSLLARFYIDTEYNLTDDGFEMIAIATEIFPENADLQISLARALFHQGDFEQAVEILLAYPDDLRALIFLAESYERLGNRGQAIQIYFRLSQSENPYRERAQQGVARLSN